MIPHKTIPEKSNLTITAVGGKNNVNIVPFNYQTNEVTEIETKENDESAQEEQKLIPRKSKIKIKSEQTNPDDDSKYDKTPILKFNHENDKVENFDIKPYTRVEVGSDFSRKLLCSSIDSIRINSYGKRVSVAVIKTANAYAMNIYNNIFEWLCTGFEIIGKVKDINSEVYVDLKITDSYNTSTIRVPVDAFAKNNLSTLNKYNIHFNPGYELTASVYFHRLLDKFPMESAQQQLGFSYTDNTLRFTGYDNNKLLTKNSYYTTEEYIENLNALIVDST
jgi:hypothetical protein